MWEQPVQRPWGSIGPGAVEERCRACVAAEREGGGEAGKRAGQAGPRGCFDDAGFSWSVTGALKASEQRSAMI